MKKINNLEYTVTIPPGKAIKCDHFFISYIKEKEIVGLLKARKEYLLSNKRGNWIDRVHEIDLILDYIDDGDAIIKLMKENRNDK